jgi:hypothetical protein
MIAELQCVVLDCPEPARLARFYAGLLGGEVDRRDRRWACGDSWSTLHTPSGLVLAFQRVADHRPPPAVPPRPRRPRPRHRRRRGPRPRCHSPRRDRPLARLRGPRGPPHLLPASLSPAGCARAGRWAGATWAVGRDVGVTQAVGWARRRGGRRAGCARWCGALGRGVEWTWAVRRVGIEPKGPPVSKGSHAQGVRNERLSMSSVDTGSKGPEARGRQQGGRAPAVRRASRGWSRTAANAELAART